MSQHSDSDFRDDQIPLSDIRTDGGTWVRATFNEPTVRRYQEVLKDGGQLPPLVVFEDGEHIWLSDGFHCLEAHRRCGYARVPVKLKKGKRRDAILYAVGANAHGLPLTDADKRRKVEMLLNDPEWVQWSDREIALQCKVSHTLVGTVRRKWAKLKQKDQLGASGNAFQIDTPPVPCAPALAADENSATPVVPTTTANAEIQVKPQDSAAEKRKVKRGTQLFEMRTGRIGKGGKPQEENAAPGPAAEAETPPKTRTTRQLLAAISRRLPELAREATRAMKEEHEREDALEKILEDLAQVVDQARQRTLL